ncbi:MAG: Glycine--tRNA ligase [Mycoplasmataceae bacterium]|nr:MAG: Glycine--tRNA ligase [Mycoplasmataceae bacterium]
MNNQKEKTIISHLKQYGFINSNAEIYQGLAKSWDLGINGAELKRKLKNLWWDYFITSNPHNFPCETAILTHNDVLEASGHKKNFSDWVIECLNCKKRIRLDNLISEKDFISFLSLSSEEKNVFKLNEKCSCKGEFSTPVQFNLMLKTNISSSSNNSSDQIVYLRPETCQGIFINFLSIKNSFNKKIPFGIGQIGKSFRNEITLNHGIFRTREFEQAELEFFVIDEKEKWWDYWVSKSWEFFRKIVNLNDKSIEKKEIRKEELPHYSLKTLDFHFNYNFGWGEVCSMSDRGDYDLKNHSEKSSHFLGIIDEDGNKKFPHVIEVSFGIERLILAILENSYREEIVEKSQLKRTYLKIHPLLSPFFVSVMPLSKQLNNESYQVYLDLIKTAEFSVSYEETGNIGNRYRRQDSIGTFLCVTIDFETKNDNKVTVRERDTMNQKRVSINELRNYILKEIYQLKEEFLS